MPISLEREKERGQSSASDAMAGESVYRVTGKSTNQAEQTASEDLQTERLSDTRAVRFKLFRWPAKDSSPLLAVLQYQFSGARPALSCPSIGMLVRLVRVGERWKVTDQYLLETVHHFSLQRVEMRDLTGDGADDLVIESDFGGAGSAGIALHIFDLSHGRLEELISTNAHMEFEDQDRYSQLLDIARTIQSRGRRFCFSTTTVFENGKPFDPPRVTHPCYKSGEGVDPAGNHFRAHMLEPLR